MIDQGSSPDGSPDKFPPILDADAMAKMLYLASGREALKMARERRLPSIKVGKRILFVRDEVVEFLAEQSRSALSDDDLRQL